MAKQAFEASRDNVWKLDPDDLVVVGIDTEDGLNHPMVSHRVLKLKEDGPSEEMVNSILEFGVLQPIVVRKNGLKAEVVLGRNRTLATREANKRRKALGQEPILIQCILRKDNDPGKMIGSIEAENNIRSGDDPLTRAKNASRALDMGRDRKSVARDFGISTEALDNLLKLQDLSPKMQAAVEQGHITPTAAVTYNDMSHEDQERVLEEAEKLGVVISVPEARRQRKARKSGAGETVSTRGKGVTIGILRKVYADEKFMAEPPSLGDFMRWVIGEVSYKTIPGLAAALRRAGEIE
jgi:ParB/RepB/Spo0J family partition protein